MDVSFFIEPEIQRKVILQFHFALNESGYPFLGTAKIVGQQNDLIATVTKKWRLYRRIGSMRQNLRFFQVFGQQKASNRVLPFIAPDTASDIASFFLICFQEESELQPLSGTIGDMRGAEVTAVQGLEKGLQLTHDDLQSTVDGMESANEVLEAIDKEVVS